MKAKRKIQALIACMVVAIFLCVIAITGSASALITDGALTAGRAFEDGESIQIGKDLTEMPKTYEAVVYVPSDVTQKGAIISNYYPLGGVGHIDFSIGIGGTNKEARPMLDITDQNNNRTRVEFRKNIKGDEWVHVVITHETNASGDVYTCYVNGEAVTNKNVNYWVDGANTANANLTHNLDMAAIQREVSMYVGQAYGYSSVTEMGSDDPYNDGGSYIPTNFKGRIKNIALYSDALTAEEIKANYNSGINAKHDSIMLCYDLTQPEEKSGYIADISGNGYDTVPLYHERTEELNANDYDYAFALLGDTQFLVDWDVKNGTSYTEDIYNWIVANKDAKKIARVLGVGDIVESGRLDSGVTDQADRDHAVAQWEYAVDQFAKLEAAGIPYTITWGYNHDGYYGEEFTTYFGNSTNFTESDIGYYFSDESSEDYGKRLANYYQRFEVAGVKYMVMCIEYRPNDAVLSWADAVIKANADHRVIISTHYFLDHTGAISQEYAQIQPKWDRLANENANVEMILCGHVARQNNMVRAYTVAKSGQTVAQFLLDPQQMDRFYGYDDTAVVAMLYFSDGGEEVRVELISASRSMRAKESDPNAEDVLYGRKNEFRFNSNGEKAPAGSKGEIDIYVIAGQSNAVGYGRGEISVEDARFTNGFENVLYYGNHEYFGGEDIDSFIPVKTGLGQGTNRSGAELGIAYKLDGNGRTTAVIKCAQGATPIYPIEGNSTLEKYGSWTPPSFMEKYPELVYHEKVGYLYERLISTLSSGFGKLEAEGYTLNIKGVFWMQGEAETGKDFAANAYEELLTDLINDLRGDLTELSGNDCSSTPFVVGKITSNHVNVPAYVDTVCAAQAAVAEDLDNVYVLDTNGLEQQDNWHYTADSQRIIGERFVDIVTNAYGNYVTPYGTIPSGSYDPVNKPLAVFADGEYMESFAAWDKALQYIKDTCGLHAVDPDAKTAQLVLLADHTPSTFHNLSQMGGTLIIDLNGFKLNVSSAVMNGNCKPVSGKMCTTTVVFKNGDITIGSKSISDLYVPSNAVGDKTISYTFEKVNFSFREGASASVLSIGNGTSAGSYKLYVDLTFNGCTFDLATNAKSGAKMFSLAKSEIIGSIAINGGKIIKASCTAGSLFGVDAADTVTFGKYDGKYTEIELPTGVAPAAERFTAAGGKGNLYFAKSGTLTDADVYTLTEVTTKYGDIPTEYLSTEEYPFVVFVFDGDELLSSQTKGFASLHGNSLAIDYAKSAIRTNVYSAETGYDGQLSAVILMRRDYTVGSGEAYYNHGQIRGVITYDLGGYTISQTNASGAKSIMYIQSKAYSGYDVNEISPSFIRVINGNMVTYTAPIVTLAVTPSSSANYTIGDKTFGIDFENVTFSVGEGATVTSLMLGYGTSNIKPTTQDPNPMGNFDISFHDCYIDLFQNVKSGSFTIFNLSPAAKNGASVDVKFYGGTIRGREWDGSGSGNNIKITRNAPTNGSTIFFEKSATTGEYLKVLLTPGAAAPKEGIEFTTSVGKTLSLSAINTTGSSYVYSFKESEYTKYGDIPASAGSATDYPFALFVYPAGSDTPVYVGVYKELLGVNNGVFNYAKNQLQNNEWNNGYDGQIKAVIYMRADYTLGEGEYYSNFAQIRGEIIFDLGGHTLSQYSSASAKPLFGINSKPWGADGMGDGHTDVFPSTITIENGAILTYNGAIFKFNINSSSATPESLANKLFTINMNGVTIGLKEGATATELLISYGNATTGSDAHDKDFAPFIFNLNDCVIDLDTVKPAGNMTIFNINGASKYVSATVNMMGGEIKLGSADGVTVAGKVGSGSAFTFVKVENGYTSLILPEGADAPSDAFDTAEGKMCFVATDVPGVYVLAPKGCEHVYDNACDADCNLCGETRETEHDYNWIVIDPDCVNDGYTIYICDACDYTFESDVVPALGHSYNAVTTAPDCVNGGYTTYTCANCGDSYVGNETDAVGHSYEAVVTAPTCTEVGYTTYTCACGDTYVADETAALGHVYDNDRDADCNNCGEIREIAVIGGTCGTNATWRYEDGVLYIEGTGSMNAYSSKNMPWLEYKNEITTVIVAEGIRSIGKCSFYECTNLTSVTLPSTLRTINPYAFYGCSGLTEITLPASLTAIKQYAFRRSGLTSATFENDCGWYAGENKMAAAELSFENGAALHLVKYGFKADWTRDVNAAPEVYNLIAMGYCGTNARWTLDNEGTLSILGSGVVINCTSKEAPWTAYKNEITKVVIGEGITKLGKSAFYEYANITEVVLPSTLTEIGHYAFYGCKGLTEVTIPASVTTIGSYVFRKSGVTSVTFENTEGWSYKGNALDVTDAANVANLLKNVKYINAWTK